MATVEVTAAVRRPVLRPRPASGRAIPYARAMRLRLDDEGALVLTRPDGPQRRLAVPGEVTRALWLEPSQTADLLGRDASYAGALLLLAGLRPVLAVRLQDWSPPAQHDPALLRVTTGVEALAAALGLPLEPAEPRDAQVLERRAVRQVEVRPLPPDPAPGRAVRALGPLAALLGLLAWPLGGTPAAPVLTTLSLLLCASVGLGVARGRSQARAAATSPSLEPAGRGIRVPVRPVGPVPRAVLDNALVLTGDELFLRRRETVVWLPGPMEAGVVQAVMEPEHVRLADHAGHDLARLETALWCGDDAARAELADDLRAGGLRVLDAPIDSVPTHDRGDLATAHVKPSLLQSTGERGDPTTLAPWWAGLAAALAAGGALGTLGWSVPVGLLLLALALGLLAVSWAGAWRRRQGDRAAVRLVDVPQRPAVRVR